MTQEQSEHRRMIAMAMYVARGIVKDQLKRKGIRLVDVEAKVIGTMAMAYIAAHPEEVYAEVKARLAARVPLTPAPDAERNLRQTHNHRSSQNQ
jgi:hypothetical protein